jgi:hypothetical protein
MFLPSSSLRKIDGSPDSERRSDYASPLPTLHFWPAEGLQGKGGEDLVGERSRAV